MSFHEKYLKYKKKYLELKGGVLDDFNDFYYFGDRNKKDNEYIVSIKKMLKTDVHVYLNKRQQYSLKSGFATIQYNTTNNIVECHYPNTKITPFINNTHHIIIHYSGVIFNIYITQHATRRYSIKIIPQRLGLNMNFNLAKININDMIIEFTGDINIETMSGIYNHVSTQIRKNDIDSLDFSFRINSITELLSMILDINRYHNPNFQFNISKYITNNTFTELYKNIPNCPDNKFFKYFIVNHYLHNIFNSYDEIGFKFFNKYNIYLYKLLEYNLSSTIQKISGLCSIRPELYNHFPKHIITKPSYSEIVFGNNTKNFVQLQIPYEIIFDTGNDSTTIIGLNVVKFLKLQLHNLPTPQSCVGIGGSCTYTKYVNLKFKLVEFNKIYEIKASVDENHHVDSVIFGWSDALDKMREDEISIFEQKN